MVLAGTRGFDTPGSGGLLSRLIHVFNPLRSDNGCVVMSRCDGQWLALTESGRVTRLDVESLATEGELAWTDGGEAAPYGGARGTRCSSAAQRVEVRALQLEITPV